MDSILNLQIDPPRTLLVVTVYICILIHIIYLNLLQPVYHKQAQQQSKNTHHLVSACNRVFAARFLKTSLPSNGSTDLALAYLVVREALIKSRKISVQCNLLNAHRN